MIVVPPRCLHNWWPLLSEHAAPMLRDTFVFWWLSTSSLSFGLATSATVPPCCSFISLSFFATSSHELSPWPRPSWASQQLARPRLSSATATRPATTLFGLSSSRPATSLFGPSSSRPATSLFGPSSTRPATSLFGPSSTRPATSLFGLSSTRLTTSSTSATARASQSAPDDVQPATHILLVTLHAASLGTVLCSFVSLPQPLCFFPLLFVALFSYREFFFAHNSLEGEYCSVPPSHTTHKQYLQLLNFVLSYFIFIVHIQLSYNAFLFTHARSSTLDWHRHQSSQLDSFSLSPSPPCLSPRGDISILSSYLSSLF